MVLPFVNPCDYGDPEPCGVNPSFIYTRYPCDFDDPRPTDTRGLPITVDNRTPVKAEVVNRQRESILAIEAELGIQPSGTFTTVRARLDALESLLCAIWERLQDTGSPVNVLLNGTTIVLGVQNINFTGTGVNVINAGGNQANIEITAGGGGDVIQQFVCNVDGYMPVHVALPVVSDGQQFFTLPGVPYKDILLLFIGGFKQEIGNYIVSSNQLEWLGDDLTIGDVVEVFFTVYGGQGDGYEPVHEALPVNSPGQTVFNLNENPWDELVLLFIGGIKQEIGDYTVTGNQLTWNGSTPLITSDVVEVLYFKRIPGENCGSGSILSVADESIIVENNVEIIDFQGVGITAIGDGAGRVTVTVSGASTIMHQEVFSALASQTLFTLTYTPISQQSTELFIDGVSQTVGTDYTVSGSVVTYSGIPTLTGTEEVVVKYFEDLSIISVPGLPDVLKISNITDGYNINFGNNTRGINALDPVNSQDIATKAYVDSVSGLQNLSQVLSVGNSSDGYNIDLVLSSRVINSLNPVNPQDLATKSYIDGYISTWGLPSVLSINNNSGGYNILMSGNSSVQSPDASGVTQALTIRTGDSGTSNAGLLTLRGGNTSGNAQGGAVVIDGGDAPIGQPNSVGGAITINGGVGGLKGGDLLLTGGNANTSTSGSKGGSIIMHPGDGELAGSVIVDIDNNLTDGYFEVINVSGTGIHIGSEAIATASHNYALVWDQDGYNKYVQFPSTSGAGYLGVDVFVRTLADFPAPLGGFITLAPNTVYGIDGTVNIGANVIIASTGSKLIGGGGSSTTSAIVSTNTLEVLSVINDNVTVDGLMVQNLGSGPAILIGADNYFIVDAKFVTAGNLTVVVSNPGLGQITDSFIYVPQNGSGILISQDTTSFLVKNTKFKGVGIGYGTGISLDSTTGTITVSQVVVEGCNFEDLGTSMHQESDVIVNGNLALVGCSGTNIDTFIKTEVGTVTQSAVVANNIIWNCSLFSIGLNPGGNHVFRGNLMHGIAQTESPIV